MVLDASLGDIVQKQRDEEKRAVAGLDRAHQLGGERRILAAVGLDVGKDADAAQQMLVHRVVVIHVELHHRDDTAEGAHEVAEHAGLVHAPQHCLGVVLGGEDIEEEAVGLGVLAQLAVDQLERARDRAQRVGVEGQIVFLRQVEDADQVDRIALEHVGIGHHDAVVVDVEILGLGQRAPRRRPELRHHAAQHRHRLGLAVLEFGAEEGGEIADVLRDQEVVLHEPLDVLQARMLGIAEPHRDLALDVERQTLLGAAGEEVHVAAHRPEEILAAAEQHVFAAVEHALLDQLFGLAHAVDVFGDPEQRVQITQSTLAVLDVGLDQIARLPGATVALLALGKLGGDEFRAGALRHLLVEARDQFVEQLAVAKQIAGLQDAGADRHVGLGLPDAFVDRAGGVADLESDVPEAIENRLGDRLAPSGLLVGKDEQEIDVGARRQQAAPVAAGRDHSHAFGFRGILRRIQMPQRKIEQEPDESRRG